MYCPIEFRTDYCECRAIIRCLITGTPIQGSRRWEAVTVTEVESVEIGPSMLVPSTVGEKSDWRRTAQSAIDGNADLQARAEELLETASRDAKSFRRAG